MADELDALLERIEDDGLRRELHTHVERLRRKRQFGLVFEAHLPERVRLPDHPIRRGSRVVRRDAPLKEEPVPVLRVRGAKAELDADGGVSEVAVEDLVVVAEFGEPIYPGLRRLDSLACSDERPAHVLIKGENYHALQALQFTHSGKVDCIYIDPPYNNRSKDWKYNNDYVDREDVFKHSKWLAMMQRRLLLARHLLNPERSTLIVTVDENEVHRLGLLLEQVFPNGEIQMVTSVISAKGAVRRGKFSRVEEHIFFVTQGDAHIARWTQNMLNGGGSDDLADDIEDQPPDPKPIAWLGLRRREPSSTRGARPNQFYPIFVDAQTGHLHSVGDAVPDGVDRRSVDAPPGTVALWPLKPNGDEMLWGLTPEVLRDNWASGFARVNNWKPNKATGTVKYLPAGTIAQIRDGRITVTGRGGDGSVQGFYSPDFEQGVPAKRVWHMASHNAEIGGTNLLSSLIPNRRFDYPKSVYAVEDTLRFVVGDAPAAVVLDFFAGSGTTAHAVARLNRQDGGRRQSISITNNEVSAEEAEELRQQGRRPGDPEWEELGVFEHITRPRVAAAISGCTPQGEAVAGEYRFTDEFPISEGFEENAEFFELKYLDIEDVELDQAFEAVAPLLWLRAGGVGALVERRCEDSGKPKRFDMTEHYGVLFDPDHWRGFVERLPQSARTVFIVTDSPSVFASIAAELRPSVEAVRLYENYLTTFAINRGF